MGELLHLVQQGGDCAGPLLAVPNVTAHPSKASVSITALLYNGPLLCGFNVAIKGLTVYLFRRFNYVLYLLCLLTYCTAKCSINKRCLRSARLALLLLLHNQGK